MKRQTQKDRIVAAVRISGRKGFTRAQIADQVNKGLRRGTPEYIRRAIPHATVAARVAVLIRDGVLAESGLRNNLTGAKAAIVVLARYANGR